MPDDLTDAIAEAAQKPAEASGDAGSMKAVSIPDMIAADQYAKGEAALSGENESGGPVSAWGAALRPARAVPKWSE